MAILARQRRGVAALLALALLMSVLAFLHKGVPAARLDLNDGGVWVTNQTLKLAGHLNYPSRILDGGVSAGSGEFDVSQAANTVLLADTGAAKWQNVDGAEMRLGEGAALTKGLAVAQGGQVAVASDTGAGKVWVLDAARGDGFSAESEPVLDKAVGVRAAAGTDGVVHLVLADGSVKKVVDGRTSDEGRIEGIVDLRTADLTVVGDTVVVLDKAGSAIRTPRGIVTVPTPDKLALQLPGPANDRVLLAGPDAHLWAPLAGGSPTVVPNNAGAGTPARPAYLGGCGYLAWGGSGAYVRTCANPGDDQAKSVERLKSATALAFRVNRDVIVLNELVNGAVLLVNDDMRVVDNWKVVTDSVKARDDETMSTTETVDELNDEKKRENNTKPEAADDEYGVRAGRSFTLPVLENDTDPDGDLLTASVTQQPTGAVVSQVRGGEALSIAVPSDAKGPFTFTYTAADGRGGEATARVTVTVYPDDVNEAPKPKARKAQVTVANKGETTYSLLSDFVDPEGDPMFLEQGIEQPSGLAVKGRPDGVVSVKSLGTGGAGVRKVNLSVSDGRKSGTGVLNVTVAADALPPIANTDHVTLLKGADAVVRPLANDADPMGRGLRLASVDEPPAGLTVVPDYTAGTFRLTATTPGTHYLSYQVTNESPTAAQAYVRVDVTEPAEGRPVPAEDLAMLPLGGSVVVDALANDTDPAGGVLVLKSVSVRPESSVAVEILDHGSLRVSAPAGLTAPESFGYVVSNGAEQAEGRVTVVPLPKGASTPPNAVNDKAVVRLGDIVTVPVLANDQSPTGLPLTIDSKVTIEGDAAAGDAFVSRDVVRFRAKKAGTVRVNYTIRDTEQNFATAQIVLTVNPLDMPNTPPLPREAVGRVLAGRTVTIPVGTDGIDPEGDSTTLVGLASGPTKGAAQATATGIEYTAPAGAVGTDTFTYEVADRFGAKATAQVRVGIAPPNTTNASPVAVPDEVATRPGRTLGVNAVANDVDPDGDELQLVADSVTPVDDKTTATAVIAGASFEVTTPEAEGVQRFYYGVTDGRGGNARGVVSVRVSKDAVLKPPVARDDVVTADQVKAGQPVEVDVLANDADPDGVVSALKLSTDDPGASVTGAKLTVTPTDQRQIVLYTVTDPDGNTARAAVAVPPADSAAPYLNLAKLPAKVKAGELLTLPLAEYVIVRDGRTPILTFAEKATAGAGADGATAPVKDAGTLQYRSTPEFAGRSSVTFEVTDGATADDPAGRLAVLSIPIEVEAAPAAKHPPVFTATDVTAEAGGEPVKLDLRQLASDVDPGDNEKLVFAKGATTGNFTVNLSGSTLEVSAPKDAQVGATGSVALTVTDGSTEPVPATVQLKVTASTRPLMAVSTAVVTDAKEASPSTIDLADYVTNPFPGDPVTLVGTPTASPAGAKIEVDGLRVTVTPPAGYHGQIVVSYTVQDATKTVSRQVRGTIQLTVRAKPDAPTGLTGETHLSRTVTLTWTAGANNGAEITKFTAKWTGNQGGSGTKDCGQVTTCLIDTLKNDETYVFKVTATNEVGESPESLPSAGLRPDVKPNPPGTPVGTFGDKQIALTWPAATTDGSAVTKYTVQISPGGTTQTATGTSLTWTGLTNGTAYTFRVQAHNADPNPSDWSAPSAPVVPAGPPATPAAPTATKDPVSALPPAATISWVAPNGNGDNNLTYELRAKGTTTVLYTGTNTSAHVVMSTSTNDVTYELRAKNKADWSAWSAASNPIRGWQTPSAVKNLTATATGTNNQVTVSFGAADGNGALPAEVSYFWTANGQSGSFGTSLGGTITNGAAFPNGQNVNVSVYARSTVKGESVSGPATGASVNAYGPPIAPNVYDCSSQYQAVVCSWSGGSDGGRSTSYFLTANGSGGANSSGTTTMGAGFGETRSLQVCARQTLDGGGTRDVCGNTGSNKAWDAPAEVWTDSGRRTSAGYIIVNLELRRWRPGSSVYCAIQGSGGFVDWSRTFGVDGAGHWGPADSGVKSAVAVDSTWNGNCSQR